MTDKTQLEQIADILVSYEDTPIDTMTTAQQILDVCQPHKKACERITVLALKHCPKSHHRDWEEVKALSYIFVPSTVPENTA